MNTWKVVAITVLAIMAIGGLAAYGFLAAEGLSARKKPSDFEYTIANTALGISIPSGAKNQKNPLNVTREDLADAKKHYKEHCEVCHAENGGGRTETAAGMSPEVPDLRDLHQHRIVHRSFLLRGRQPQSHERSLPPHKQVQTKRDFPCLCRRTG